MGVAVCGGVAMLGSFNERKLRFVPVVAFAGCSLGGCGVGRLQCGRVAM